MEKPSHLLCAKKVIKAPDPNPKTRWVASDTSSCPHVATTTKINPRRYICDKQYIGWKVVISSTLGGKSYNICTHCMATAEDNKELGSFMAWFASSKQNGGLLCFNLF